MKQFFKMMFASALGGFLAIGIFFLVGIVMFAGIVSSLDSSNKTYTLGKNEKVLSLQLKGSLSEISRSDPLDELFSTQKTTSLKDILSSIEMAKENENIKGIYIDASFLRTGIAGIDAIRRKLIDFKESGKFIVAYADSYTQRCYYLSSVADKIFMNPQGSLFLHGFASQTTFYKGLLKKAGVEMLVFKVGTYKGAVEPFMLDKLSDDNREQITSYQQSVWGNFVGGIASSRNISENQINDFADNGHMLSSADKAVEYKLIDALKYRHEAEEYVKEQAGIDSDKKLKTVSVNKIIKTGKARVSAEKDRIAILYAEGEIISSESRLGYDNRGNKITEDLANELIKLKKEEDVKAVVLRVNSPGGSGYISEQIWKQVNELKEEKTIVVSMGNMAASGGYYISCAADKIISEANTLTGSIGVFGLFPNMTGLFDKLDLTTDVVKTNQYADLGDPSRPMREEEKQLIQGSVERFYEVFLTRCAEGRGVAKAYIDSIGQGRVWTGEQALEIGLVDEIGGLERAIETAAELADLSDYSVYTVSTSENSITEYLKKQMEDVKLSITKDVLGDDMKLFDSLQMMKTARGIKARIPYDFEAL